MNTYDDLERVILTSLVNRIYGKPNKRITIDDLKQYKSEDLSKKHKAWDKFLKTYLKNNNLDLSLAYLVIKRS